MKTSKLTSVQVVAKEWFDKVNGNSYFSAQVTIEKKDGTNEEFKIPFQYGYGDTFEDAAGEKLKEYFNHREISIQRWCRENGIKYYSTKHTKCLQREVKAWGAN